MEPPLRDSHRARRVRTGGRRHARRDMKAGLALPQSANMAAVLLLFQKGAIGR
jgi:hypothetical protein